MRKINWKHLTAIIGMMALALAHLAIADEGKQKTITAEVISVDTEANRLMVRILDREIGEHAMSAELETPEGKQVGEKMGLAVDSDTEIREDTGFIALAELTPGERLNVTYVEKDDGAQARKIERKSKK